MTMGILKLEVLPRKLDWVVLEFTIIRTAAEGVKISVYLLRRLLSSLFNLANRIWDSTFLYMYHDIMTGDVRARWLVII